MNYHTRKNFNGDTDNAPSSGIEGALFSDKPVQRRVVILVLEDRSSKTGMEIQKNENWKNGHIKPQNSNRIGYRKSIKFAGITPTEGCFIENPWPLPFKPGRVPEIFPQTFFWSPHDWKSVARVQRSARPSECSGLPWSPWAEVVHFLQNIPILEVNSFEGHLNGLKMAETCEHLHHLPMFFQIDCDVMHISRAETTKVSPWFDVRFK